MRISMDLAEAGDVQKHNLVRTVSIVPLGEGYWLSQVPNGPPRIAVCASFTDVILKPSE